MNANRTRNRRGVTLVEMMVTLAVLLLMMALIVQIFQVATGSMSAAQAYQQLDDQLRRVDSVLRSDLNGATAKFTPPNDPKDNRGYFEYGENEFADNQGEDADDYIRFTAKAPAGRPFVGRMWAKPMVLIENMSAAQLAEYRATQPISVTSEFAEIIYFLRNGNLYRRVLLVAPELQSKIVHSVNNTGYFPNKTTGSPTIARPFQADALGANNLSWQGVNDLSAHPAPTGMPFNNNSVILNTLADLTDRHKRFGYSRFANDFLDLTGAVSPDGVPEDLNGDDVPDVYPSLYPNIINTTAPKLWNPYNPNTLNPLASVFPTLGFPYVFRGAYSRPQFFNAANNYRAGWIHAPAPVANSPLSTRYRFEADPVNYLKNLNHNPMDAGDNLPRPFNAAAAGSNLQTLWQFPTWRETLSPNWNDPTFQVNQPTAGPVAPNGLAPIVAAEITAGVLDNTGVAGMSLLPAMTAVWRGALQAQLFTDGWGDGTVFHPLTGGVPPALWTDQSWEDDLILTNVRSFDVKALDTALGDYADLGWGDDVRITPGATAPGAAAFLGTGYRSPYLFWNYDAFRGSARVALHGNQTYAYINGGTYDLLAQTFAHEGRMPPLVSDNRYDAQFGPVVTGTYTDINTGNASTNNGNIGDNEPSVVRLRRVWDSWSTTYSKAPGMGVLPNGFPYGPPANPPVYPSYPAPYPAPLRGIQIQIRVVDPTNQRIKALTIRQDFTDKL